MSVPVFHNTVPSYTVAKDARYFRRNPTAKQYTRSATAEECDWFDLPKGTKVVVVRLSKDKHARLFQTPDAERN